MIFFFRLVQFFRQNRCLLETDQMLRSLNTQCTNATGPNRRMINKEHSSEFLTTTLFFFRFVPLLFNKNADFAVYNLKEEKALLMINLHPFTYSTHTEKYLTVFDWCKIGLVRGALLYWYHSLCIVFSSLANSAVFLKFCLFVFFY